MLLKLIVTRAQRVILPLFRASKNEANLLHTLLTLLLTFEFSRGDHEVLLCKQQMSTNYVGARWRYLIVANF